MRPETVIQRAILANLRARGLIAVHVPNGATLSGNARQRAIQMNALKADGFCVGFPDLIIYGQDGKVGHIEVKIEGGRQTDTQKTVQAWMDERGHLYAVCRSIEDVAETLEGWGWL
jgi:hypothetical protein